MYQSYLTALTFVLTCVPARTNVSWEGRYKRQSSFEARHIDTPLSPLGICILPPFPENGKYSVVGSSDAGPGDQLSATQLQVTCHPGYQPLGNHNLMCVFGKWSDSMPECVRYCQLNSHPSVKYLCHVHKDDSEDSYFRECQEHEPAGTIVSPQCNKPNYHFTGVLPNMRCVEGRWNYIATCLPECGTVTHKVSTLVIGGKDAGRGEFPWHAGVYRKDFTPYKLICGGSLVSSTVVISAAHCFWDKVQNQLVPNSSFAIALGKLYRGWNNPMDKEAQTFDVANVKVPVRYQGIISNFQDDIAAVWLSAAVVYRHFIRPVCLDFDSHFEALQLQDGNLGKVAGWGIKDQEGNPSPTLLVIELPYVRIERCLEESPSSFRPYITSDKICAGYTNGSAVCQGDSGGGLVFMARELVSERYYLRGIVSTAPETEAACNAFARTSFTKITKHRSFIEKNMILYEETTTVTREPDTLCVLPPYPSNGSYSMLGLPGARPGQGYYHAELIVNCDQGFELETDSIGSCSFGNWDSNIPKCIPIRTDGCKKPAYWQDSFKCSDDPNSPKRVCKEFEHNGTFVTIDCSPAMYFHIFNRSIVSTGAALCINGVWDGDLSCSGDKNCGRVTLPEGSELPWTAIIYTKTGYEGGQIANPKIYCGATIINNLHIMTAAHCVVDRQTSEIVVAAGKIYPKYDDPRDINSQKVEVAEIILANNYNRKSIVNDIALVRLRNRFEYNSFVQPICLDWSFDVNKIIDAVAKTASWRMSNPEREDLSKKAMLRSVAVKIVDKEHCLQDNQKDFWYSYLTPDKICTKDIVGQGVCAGDSGLGLVYPVKGRYVLLGVVSTGQSDKPCSPEQVIIFSSVYYNQINQTSL